MASASVAPSLIERQRLDDGFQEFIHGGFLLGGVKAKGGRRSAGERLHAIDGGVVGDGAHQNRQDRAVRGVAEDRREVEILTVLDHPCGAGGVFDTAPQAGAFAPFEIEEAAGSRRRLAVFLFLEGLVLIVQDRRCLACPGPVDHGGGAGGIDPPGRHVHGAPVRGPELTSWSDLNPGAAILQLGKLERAGGDGNE